MSMIDNMYGDVQDVADISLELTEIKNESQGSKVRAPIISILDKLNNFAGSVNMICDDEGNTYTHKTLLTYEAVVDYFTKGYGYLSSLPKSVEQGKKAMYSYAIYNQLVELDELLKTIIGGE